MQTIQQLNGTGSCTKYLCKYIANIDEQNYVVVWVNREVRLVTKYALADLIMGEYKDREKILISLKLFKKSTWKFFTR